MSTGAMALSMTTTSNKSYNKDKKDTAKTMLKTTTTMTTLTIMTRIEEHTSNTHKYVMSAQCRSLASDEQCRALKSPPKHGDKAGHRLVAKKDCCWKCYIDNDDGDNNDGSGGSGV